MPNIRIHYKDEKPEKHTVKSFQHIDGVFYIVFHKSLTWYLPVHMVTLIEVVGEDK